MFLNREALLLSVDELLKNKVGFSVILLIIILLITDLYAASAECTSAKTGLSRR